MAEGTPNWQRAVAARAASRAGTGGHSHDSDGDGGHSHDDMAVRMDSHDARLVRLEAGPSHDGDGH